MALQPSFRPMERTDLSGLLEMQERGAVAGLGNVFPQDAYPFPRELVRARWTDELRDPSIVAYVAIGPTQDVVGFAARRSDELLHFGTAPETWGSGLAKWLHDQLVATYPPELDRLWLRVFADNHRARRLWEKLGWTSTGRESRTSYAPYPVLMEYEKRLRPFAQ